MSAIALLVVVFIAIVAAGLRALITGVWEWRSFVADVVFALAILLLPGFIHA